MDNIKEELKDYSRDESLNEYGKKGKYSGYFLIAFFVFWYIVIFLL